MARKERIAPERIRELLNYDQSTGVFTWMVDRRCGQFRSVIVAAAGSKAGCIRPDGYMSVSLDHRRYQMHVIAWAHANNEFPPDGFDIDHIDGNRSNNAIANLRLVTRAQNLQNLRTAKSHNRSSGVLGVHWDSQRNKWRAVLNCQKRRIDLGFFATVGEAAKAREEGEKKFFTHAPNRNYRNQERGNPKSQSS